MRVTLVTEGTYPTQQGGVSVWCDHLVNGLAEVDFDVLALTTDGAEPVRWKVPKNIRSVRQFGVWASSPERHARRVSPGVFDFVDTLATCLTVDHALDDQRALTDVLANFVREAHDGQGFRDLMHPATVDRFVDLVTANAVQLQARTGAPATLHDALTTHDLVMRCLAPLSFVGARSDLSHAVSNGLAALPCLAAKWLHGTPFILTEHGIYLRERYLTLPDGGYSSNVQLMLFRFYRLITRIAYQEAELINPGSIYNRRWEERNGADPERIAVAHSGIDPGGFSAETPEPAVPTLVWVGRLDPLKDVETLLRGFRLVVDKLPDTKLRLFDSTPRGNEWYRDQCLALVEQLDLRDSVHFEGRVADIADAYAAATVVVLTSISEGFPYTVIEAMMAGKPTVSTAVGGVAEGVGTTGLLVDPRDPVAFASACVELLRPDAALRREELGRAARDRALRLFTIERFLDRYRDLYIEVGGSSERPNRDHGPSDRRARWNPSATRRSVEAKS